MVSRVDTLLDHFLGGYSSVPRFGQTHIREHAERIGAILTVESVVPLPIPLPACGDEHVQAVGVGQFVGLGLRLRADDGGVG